MAQHSTSTLSSPHPNGLFTWASGLWGPYKKEGWRRGVWGWLISLESRYKSTINSCLGMDRWALDGWEGKWLSGGKIDNWMSEESRVSELGWLTSLFVLVLIASLQRWLTGLSKVFSLNSHLGLCLAMKVGRGGGWQLLTSMNHASNSRVSRNLHKGL